MIVDDYEGIAQEMKRIRAEELEIIQARRDPAEEQVETPEDPDELDRERLLNEIDWY